MATAAGLQSWVLYVEWGFGSYFSIVTESKEPEGILFNFAGICMIGAFEVQE